MQEYKLSVRIDHTFTVTNDKTYLHLQATAGGTTITVYVRCEDKRAASVSEGATALLKFSFVDDARIGERQAVGTLEVGSLTLAVTSPRYSVKTAVIETSVQDLQWTALTHAYAEDVE